MKLLFLSLILLNTALFFGCFEENSRVATETELKKDKNSSEIQVVMTSPDRHRCCKKAKGSI